jgi:hypothetical protein
MKNLNGTTVLPLTIWGGTSSSTFFPLTSANFSPMYKVIEVVPNT